jgi:ATP-binding cassette, subfamily B, bacterial MsbA
MKRHILELLESSVGLQWRRLGIVGRLFRVMGVQPHQVAIPVMLSLVVAALDGIGLSLLLPLAKGLTTGSYGLGAIPFLESLLDFVRHTAQQVSNDSTFVFFLLMLVIFLLNVLRICVELAGRLYEKYLEGMFRFRIHTLAYKRYFRFGKFFFDTTSQGYTKTILDYADRSTKLVDVFQRTTHSVFRLGVHLVVMVFISWPLTVFVLVAFPVLQMVINALVRWVQRAHEESTQVGLEKGREAFNMLSAMPLVWSYSQEEPAKRKYSAMNEKIRRLRFRGDALSVLSIYVQELLIFLVLIIMVAFASLVLAAGNPEQLISFIVLIYIALRALPMLRSFTDFRLWVAELGPEVVQVLSVFEDGGKHVISEGDRQFAGLREAIEFKNLTYAYGNNIPVLRDLSLTFRKGEVTALVGPSGGGKSTIVSLLMRYYDCPPNAIFIDGVDIREFTLRSLRHHIAIVSQETWLLNDTFYNNIAYGLTHVSEGRVRAAVRSARLEEVLARLPRGFESEIGDRGVQLSGGEKQRVAIARALLKGSEILLLDEATSALDSGTERLVQDALDQVIKNRTAIVIAHRLSTIRQASVIVYLENGQVTERGGFEELLARRGRFYAQWREQGKRG